MGYSKVRKIVQLFPKHIASTILLKLVQDEKISLNDSIKKVIPGYDGYFGKVKQRAMPLNLK